MSDRNRPAVLRRRSLCALPGLSVLVTLCAILGCASTPPYYLIESRYTESGRSGPPPDVTQTPDFPAVHHLIQLVALKPPDVCADRGQSGRLGTASLELGVLRTRCGVEMAELERALAEGPDGMSISEDTGMIKWTPRSDQVMLYKVVVNVSDGIDHTKVMFTIDVLEGDGSGSISILLMAGPAVVLILLAVGIFFFIRSRRSREEEDVKEEDIEEQIIGGFPEEVQAQIKCDVALTPTEAHSHLGKGSKKVSYEELYGLSSPPEQEEGMTTRELKDFITDQIEELEAMEE